MGVLMQVDTSGLEAHLLRLATVARETIPFIAEENERRIKALTSQGASYTGEIFHAYGISQLKKREEAGLVTDIKNLYFTGGLMGSFEFTATDTGGYLTVGEDYQKIALGQQTGHSGDWAYDHKFIGVSEEGQQEALESWSTHMRGRLIG